MAKELRLDVVTSSDGKGLIESADEVEHLAKKVDDLGDQLRETAIDADAAGHEVDDLGDKMRQTAVDGGALAIELAATKQQLKELGAQFDYTGDKAILKTISATRRYSGQLEKLKKDMEDVAQASEEAENAGSSAGGAVVKGFLGSLEDIPTSVPVIVGALVSPGTYGILAMAGEVMGGAILTGIGLAGIGSGIALSINAPEVQSAIGRLKTDVSSGLQDAASSFVAPFAGAVDAIDAEFQQLMPGIKDDFAAIAPEVAELGKGAAGFMDEVIPAFGDAVVAAKPLLQLLADDLPALGHTLGGLFEVMADHAGTAELGLQDIIRLVDTVINLVAGGIVIFSKLSDTLNTFELDAADGAKTLLDVMIDIADAAHLPDQGLHNLDDKLGTVVSRLQANKQMAEGATLITAHYADEVGHAASNIDDLATQLLNFNTQLSAMNGLMNRTEALNNLTIGTADFVKQLKDSKGAFDANTVAGALNQNSYIGLIKKAEEYRQTLIDSHVPQAQADLMFQNWVKDLDKAADKAGWSASQIAILNAQLGITAAMKPIKIPITVTTTYSSTGDRPNLGHNIPFLAGGGHFDPGPIVVGEKGKEILWPDSAGTIIPLGSGAGVGGHTPVAALGGGTTTFVLEVRGDTLAKQILAALRPEIRGFYGGDVTAALAGNRN